MHIFLSPHFDDAVGSCGGLIKSLSDAGASVSVMTIMSGVPWRTKPSKLPKVLMRKLENIFACRSLGAGHVNAGFLDAIFRQKAYPKKSMLFDGAPIREKEMVLDIAEWIKTHSRPTDTIYAPSGLGNHIDHRIVVAAAKLLPNKVIFYEEFYYDWKHGIEMPGYFNYYLARGGVFSGKIRAVKKYRIEMAGLFKSKKTLEKYFYEFRTDKNGPFESYSEPPHVPELIVTFTSFPTRIGTVNQAVETIWNNTVRPNRVVIYLAKTQFPGKKLPTKLKNIEVRWTDIDIRSYKKLVPALADFPDDFLITIDDDLMYDRDLIKRLLRAHKRYPNAIIAGRTRIVKTDGCGGFLPYKEWKRLNFFRYFMRGSRPHLDNLATTGGGTLFPPHSLSPDVMRADVFMKICPTTDDLWFWAMAVRNGTKTAPSGYNRPLVAVDGTQEISLSQNNVHGPSLNDVSIRNIADEYPDLNI